jgi:DNA adenine methylase
MIEPFLKWAGGKRWLVAQDTNYFPRDFRRYYEPFLGSAAVYFHLLPHHAVLSDSNLDLINTYIAIKRNPHHICNLLEDFQQSHSAWFYTQMREADPKDLFERAARFIYLNRTCFNGIYRVNHQGQFNVPMGSRNTIRYPMDYLERIAAALKGARLRHSDYEAVVSEASEGDFIYVDPPYTVMHNTNNFVRYNSNLFSWADQVRLAVALRRADQRGALVMLSNANHKSIRHLYAGYGIHHRVKRLSMLAGKPQYRKESTELIITNYEVHTK